MDLWSEQHVNSMKTEDLLAMGSQDGVDRLGRTDCTLIAGSGLEEKHLKPAVS